MKFFGCFFCAKSIELRKSVSSTATLEHKTSTIRSDKPIVKLNHLSISSSDDMKENMERAHEMTTQINTTDRGSYSKYEHETENKIDDNHKKSEQKSIEENEDDEPDDPTIPKEWKRFEKIPGFSKKTLQGNIFLGYDKSNNCKIVIKSANKRLVYTNYTTTHDITSENIIKEVNIMKYITNNPNVTNGFVHFISFFEDNKCYYLIEEYGGKELYDFLEKMNVLIMENQLTSKEWLLRVQHIFKILVETIHYFHIHCHLCHLDLSLENISINDKQFHPKIIDFGLAEIFPPNNFKCEKFVGKTSYMSPEIYQKLPFDASKADVWSLGVILLMLLTRCQLFQAPNARDDANFHKIINGNLGSVLEQYEISNRVPSEVLDLLQKIFQLEDKRISIEEMIKHPFVINASLFHSDDNNNDCKNKNSVINVNNNNNNNANNNINNHIYNEAVPSN